MDPSLQLLLQRIDRLSDEFRELREGVHKAVAVADLDPEMALTRARKVLEYIVRDIFERRVKEPAGARPLENLLQRLVKDGHMPPRLEAYASAIRILGNVGTHRFGENVTAADVHQSLEQLMLILEWYFEVERPEAKLARPDTPKPRPILPAEPSAVEPPRFAIEGSLPARPILPAAPPAVEPPKPPPVVSPAPSAKDALKPPGIALYVFGLLTLIGTVAIFPIWIPKPDIFPIWIPKPDLLLLCLGFGSVVSGGGAALAGYNMLHRQWFVRCVVGCVLAMQPINIFFIVGLPIGVWGLMTLLRSGARHLHLLTAAGRSAGRRYNDDSFYVGK